MGRPAIVVGVGYSDGWFSGGCLVGERGKRKNGRESQDERKRVPESVTLRFSKYVKTELR